MRGPFLHRVIHRGLEAGKVGGAVAAIRSDRQRFPDELDVCAIEAKLAGLGIVHGFGQRDRSRRLRFYWRLWPHGHGGRSLLGRQGALLRRDNRVGTFLPRFGRWGIRPLNLSALLLVLLDPQHLIHEG